MDSSPNAPTLATYPAARTPAGIKLNNEHSIVAAIIGWQPGQGRRADTIGSLLLARPESVHTDLDEGSCQTTGCCYARVSTTMSAACKEVRDSTVSIETPRMRSIVPRRLYSVGRLSCAVRAASALDPSAAR